MYRVSCRVFLVTFTANILLWLIYMIRYNKTWVSFYIKFLTSVIWRCRLSDPDMGVKRGTGQFYRAQKHNIKGMKRNLFYKSPMCNVLSIINIINFNCKRLVGLSPIVFVRFFLFISITKDRASANTYQVSDTTR